MKTLLIFFGELRTFEHVIPHLKNLNEVDVMVSTWIKSNYNGVTFDVDETKILQKTIQVDEGDCLYLFSDGYADQFGGPKGKKFMITNLQKILLENVENPIEIQKQNLTNAFNSWKGDAEQIDDVLVIGIKI